VLELAHGADTLKSVDFAKAIEARPDCAVICTDHSVFDYDALVKSGSLIVDTRNALKTYSQPTIFRL
jgi:UDP-N-acetyl-D-mannosaminuronate dehydrogenase